MQFEPALLHDKALSCNKDLFRLLEGLIENRKPNAGIFPNFDGWKDPFLSPMPDGVDGNLGKLSYFPLGQHVILLHKPKIIFQSLLHGRLLNSVSYPCHIHLGFYDRRGHSGSNQVGSKKASARETVAGKGFRLCPGD